MKYTRFEELPCWQRTRELCRMIRMLIRDTELGHDFSLRDQIARASGSAMDNIAEGFDDGSVHEFRRFLGYAQRSCSEVQSQLYRAADSDYISEAQRRCTHELAEECRRQIKAFRRYLGGRDDGYGVAEESPDWPSKDGDIPALQHSSIPAFQHQ